MPRPIKAFACEWNCRRRITSSRTGMISHELRCKNNPVSRACATCVHQTEPYHDQPDHETGYPGYGEPWGCAIDKLPDGKLMVYQCEFWEPVRAASLPERS